MSFTSSLRARMLAIAEEFEAMSTATAGGLPNSGLPPNIDHVGYKNGLLAELKGLREELTAMGGLTAEEAGVFEIVSEGTT